MYFELARHYYEMGELENSKVQIVKFRDTNLNDGTEEAVEALMFEALVTFYFSRQTSIAFSAKLCTLYVNKDGVLASPNGAKAGAMCGIATLQQERYREAASILLKISPDHTSEISEIASAEDLALYIALSALASFSRSELHFLASSDQIFAAFCEGSYQNFTKLIEFLLDSQYSELISALDSHKSDYQTDPFLFPVLDSLLGLIKKRALLQYLSVYQNVSIKKTAEIFHLSSEQLTKLLKIYVIEGTISILIDQKNGVCTLFFSQTAGPYFVFFFFFSNLDSSYRWFCIAISMTTTKKSLLRPKQLTNTCLVLVLTLILLFKH